MALPSTILNLLCEVSYTEMYERLKINNCLSGYALSNREKFLDDFELLDDLKVQKEEAFQLEFSLFDKRIKFLLNTNYLNKYAYDLENMGIDGYEQFEICNNCQKIFLKTKGRCFNCSKIEDLTKEENTTFIEGYILKNKYRIEKVLGKGAKTITYLAKNIHENNSVIIDEFILSNNEGLLEDFIDTAKVNCRLMHPNLINYIEVLETNQTAYLIRTDEKGQTLQDYLYEATQLREDEILSIMLPVFEGIKYLHNRGILHLEIVPDNIYLRKDAEPIVIGIKEEIPHLSVIDGYSPPEQYIPNGEQTVATDIYALGAILYRMLTSNKPISSTQRQVVLLGNEKDTIESIFSEYEDKYSKEFLESIIKALSLRPNDRFQTIEEFQYAILNGIPAETNKKAWQFWK